MAGQISLKDWLSDAEYEWRQKLKPVNLVIETDFTPANTAQIKKYWGAAARALRKHDYTHYEIVKRYPALTLMALVGHASLSYVEGRFWDDFWTDTGLARDQDFESVLRHSIDEMLVKFSLARFPDAERERARKYVMVLALHAGIPVHCLGDLLGTINEHIVQGREASGAALLAWLDEPGKEYRANNLDIPVRNFFAYGAEFAIDILDRIIEFVLATNDDPELLERELESSTTGLPTVLLAELISRLRETPLKWTRSSGGASAGAKRIAIRYNADDDQVVVDLPYPAKRSEEPWRLSIDGDVRSVHCMRQWGSNAEASLTRAVIDRPVRELVVTHGPSDVTRVLGLVNRDDPLLTFSTSGEWIPRRDGLKDAVWVIYPEGNELVDPSTGDLVPLENEGSPAGWLGWKSAVVELTSVDGLQLRSNGQPIGTERQVRKDARPRFEVGEPVRGVRSVDGRPVLATRPWVLLPATRSDPPPSWRVRTRRFGSADWIVDDAWDAAEDEAAVEPFDDAEEPQLGLFEVVVTGPLGADAHLVFFIAEGLWVETSCTIRIPEGDGLTPCSAEIGTDVLTVSPSGVLEYSSNQIERLVDIADGIRSERLSVVPPYTEVRSGLTGSPVPWRVAAQLSAAEDLTQDGFVAVRAPGAEVEDFAFVGNTGDRIQVGSRHRRKPGDVFEISTQQFADAARLNESGRIVARLRADDHTIDVTALLIRPKRLGAGVVLRDNILDFGSTEEIEGLAAYVWSSTAPWRAPDVLHIKKGAAQLPDHLIDAGQLRCQLFVDDPWVIVEPPRRAPADALRIDQIGWREDGSAVEVRLARFLAGVGRLHQTVGAVPEAWAALAQVHADARLERVGGLVPVLVADPRTSLANLGNSSIALQDKMAMLIRSELVNKSFSSDCTLNDLHVDPWFGCMNELADLPILVHKRREAPDEWKETVAYLADKGGQPLINILRTGRASIAADGAFDGTVLAMASAPVGKVIATVRERSLVPRPLLEYETRRLGVYAAFLGRRAWLDSGWSKNFAAQLGMALMPIKRASATAYEALTLRLERLKGIDVEEHPWMLMSVQSMTLAFLARLEACNRIDGSYLDTGLLTVWTRFAELCPTMVATDLLMAEALTLFERKGNLIGGEL
ncbi:hypothetical protein MGAD_52110 [Mycolicibacterium gadium]|uniref:Uncharacterized protein n=2 Tax=Mycolicibacterium gadium TaxID=1794 RepID=A0A7I7WT63_MYCGU|nr:hypothetical protein MGAD_52110 [Mycolicibacterium gadium]